MTTYEIVPGDGEELDAQIAKLYPTHTYQEIADALGINPSRVKNRVKTLSIYGEIQNKCPHRTKRAMRKMRFHDIVEKDDPKSIPNVEVLED